MILNFLAGNSSGNFGQISTILNSFLGEWWGLLLGVVAGAAGLLAIWAGVKYMFAKANGDEQKVTKAREFVIGIIIAIVIMVLLAVLIPVIVGAFELWAQNNAPV